MADAMQFDLVSPERRLSSVQATEVQIPGMEGDMTVMAGHVPAITTLRPGLVRVVHSKGTDEFVVTGGLAEVTATGVTILAEQSLPRGEVTSEVHSRWVEEMREGLAASSQIKDQPGPVDDAARLLADMVAVGDHIGLGAPSRAPAP